MILQRASLAKKVDFLKQEPFHEGLFLITKLTF